MRAFHTYLNHWADTPNAVSADLLIVWITWRRVRRLLGTSLAGIAGENLKLFIQSLFVMA